MSSAFDEFIVPSSIYEERSVNSVLISDLERDIHDSLVQFQNNQEEYPYVEQLTKMLNDYEQTGYMTFLIDFKDLSKGLQDFLQRDDSYYRFISAAQNAVMYMLYKTEKEYIKEHILNPFNVKDYDYDEICKHIPTISIRIKKL